jgi:hypothetical protein
VVVQKTVFVHERTHCALLALDFNRSEKTMTSEDVLWIEDVDEEGVMNWSQGATSKDNSSDE